MRRDTLESILINQRSSNAYSASVILAASLFVAFAGAAQAQQAASSAPGAASPSPAAAAATKDSAATMVSAISKRGGVREGVGQPGRTGASRPDAALPGASTHRLRQAGRRTEDHGAAAAGFR